jgi:hypothetical protein
MSSNLRADWLLHEVAEFAKRAEQEVTERGPEALKAFGQEFQELFNRPEVKANAVNGLLRKLLADSTHSGAGHCGANILTLWYSQSLGIRLLKQRDDIASFGPNVALEVLVNFGASGYFLLLSGPPVDITWYHLESGEFGVVDSTLRIRKGETETMECGRAVYVDGYTALPWFKMTEKSLLAVITGPVTSNQFVSFDRATLAPLGASMSSEENSIIYTLLDLCEVLDCPPASSIIEELTSHNDHYIRWNAVKQLARVDLEKAESIINAMILSDPHPHIRRAAQSTLASQGANA